LRESIALGVRASRAGVMVSTAPYQNGARGFEKADLSEVMGCQSGSDPPDAFDTGS
jgi:hypothetical protein